VKRLRINLRLLLLMVAFCAVLFAWMGVSDSQRREMLTYRIADLRLMRSHAVRMQASSTTAAERVGWKKSELQCDEMIAECERERGRSAWRIAFQDN
jgi:hypothetical protein